MIGYKLTLQLQLQLQLRARQLYICIRRYKKPGLYGRLSFSFAPPPETLSSLPPYQRACHAGYMGRCGIINDVANRFQNTNLQSHWLSGRSQTCTANEIANSYSEICLQRRLKAARANPASSHAKI